MTDRMAMVPGTRVRDDTGTLEYYGTVVGPDTEDRDYVWVDWDVPRLTWDGGEDRRTSVPRTHLEVLPAANAPARQVGLRRRIYVASSWRNAYQPAVVRMLRDLGHEVYDFRNPPTRAGFHWSEIDPAWEQWTPAEYRKALNHPLAVAGFRSDFGAMQWADTCVLVLPAGRSASWELGWCAGAGKACIVYLPERIEPELMYGGAGQAPIAVTMQELAELVRR